MRLTLQIFGIGKSYRHNWPNLDADDPLPEPLVFLKPATSIIRLGQNIEVPRGCTCIQEVEIAVIIGKAGRNLNVRQASEHISGYALALDLAIGNVLSEAKANGTPWDVAKGADTFTPMGRFIAAEELADPHNVNLAFTVDGRVQQQGNTNDLIYSIPQLIAHLSGIFTLEKGDIILTGTPAGQGPILPGSTVRAEMRLPDGGLLDAVELPVIWRDMGYQRERHWLEGLE